MSSSMTEDIRTYITKMPASLTHSPSASGEGGDFGTLFHKTKTRIMNLARNNGTTAADKADILQNVVWLLKSQGSGCAEKELAGLEDMLGLLSRSDVDDVEFYIQLMELLWDGLLSERIAEILKEAFAERLYKALSENGSHTFNIIDVLSRLKPTNVAKLVALIGELATEKLPSDGRRRFLLDKVMPAMFQPEISLSVRDGLTQLAFTLLPLVQHDQISPKEMEVQIKRVSEGYIQFVGELREAEYPAWHKLWIFLVRFCGRNIHGSMELANKLLRVVEYAFRNTSYQQRLIGYDCWKEFIDNASLDLDHMCSYKQIKLLVTPLKAKFSKMEVVICKRFDVFIYLLEKLQHRAVLCLKEFLEFCFGPLSDTVEVNHKSGQGKAVFQLWGKSTNVLMEIVGHSHPDGEFCLEDKLIDLKEPVLNSENLAAFAEITARACGESFMLLKDWCANPAQQQTIVKCLWGSLIRMILNSKEASRKSCSKFLTQYLENTVKKLDEDHVRSVFTTIVDSTLSFDDRTLITDLFTPAIVQWALQMLVTTSFPDSQLIMEKVIDLFNLCLTSKQKSQYISSFIRGLHETETVENMEHICNIWLMLNDIEDFKKINATVEEVVSYLMWPICHYHTFTEALKKGVLLNWAKIYMYLCNDSEDNKCMFLLHLEKFFVSNPLRSSTIISFVAIISQFERNYAPDFVSQLFKLCSMVLTLPILPKDDLLKLCSVMLGFMDLSLPFYDDEHDDAVVVTMCNCFELVLKMHKHEDFLTSLASCIKSMPNKLKLKFLSPLSATLEKLSTHDDSKIVEDATSLLAIVRSEGKDKKPRSSPSPVFHVPNSRASRIASGLKDQAKSAKIVQQSALQMLHSPGTPIKVKGSLMPKQSPKQSPKRARKILNALPKTPVRPPPTAEDDNTADYVLVDTEVKFQPEKLSEHQREVMRRKREDIPALYQDLSQSQSQDMFKNLNSNSGSASAHAPPPRSGDADAQDKDREAAHQTSPASSNNTSDDVSVVELNDNRAHIEIIEENDAERNKETYEVAVVDTVMMKDPIRNFLEEQKTNQGYTSDTSVASSDSAKNPRKKKLSRVEAELNKLKVDIVGGERFCQTLPKRRTRSAIESEKLHLRPRSSDPTKVAKPKVVNRVTNMQQRSSSPRTVSKSKKGDQPTSTKKDTPKQLAVMEEAPAVPAVEAQIETDSSPKEQNNMQTETECLMQETQVGTQQQGNTEAGVQNTLDSVPKSPLDVPKSPKKSPLPKSPAKKLLGLSANVENHHRNIDFSVYDFKESQEEPEPIEHSYTSPEKKNHKDDLRKRKGSLESQTQKFSEDIIESSQDSFVNLNPTITSPKKRRITREKSFEQSVDNQVMTPAPATHQRSSDREKQKPETRSPQAVVVVVPLENIKEKQADHEETTHSTADTDTCETSNVTPSPLALQVDVPVKPTLTDSERALCQMDTESLTSSQFSPTMVNHIILGSQECTVSGKDALAKTITTGEATTEHAITPPKRRPSSEANPTAQEPSVLAPQDMGTPVRAQRKDSLPTSPVTGDTPIKTTELLNDTMNISPIGSEQNSSDEDKQEPRQARNSDGIFADASPLAKTSSAMKSNNFPRSTRLLNMINVETPSPVSRRSSQKKRPLRITMSPATGRIRKLMSSFHTVNRFADCGDTAESEKAPEPVLEDMLTFSRVVPSPLAVPKSSILKRKFPDEGDDGTSPCPKRKRVNFSDPITTSRKVFVKHKDEFPTFSPERLMLTATALFRGIDLEEDEDGNYTVPAVSVIPIPKPAAHPSANHDADVGPANLQENPAVVWPSQVETDDQPHLNADDCGEQRQQSVVSVTTGTSNVSTLITSADVQSNNLTTSPVQASEMTSESIGSAATPDTMDMTNPLTLKDKPMYPPLMQCHDNILPILRKVTSPMFVTSLLEDLNSKNVQTVGDLARLTEAEVNRLPFKAPAISNVYKALDAYHKKSVVNDGRPAEESVHTASKDAKPTSPVCKVSPVRKSPLKRTPVRAAVRKIYPQYAESDAADDQQESEAAGLVESTNSNHEEPRETISNDNDTMGETADVDAPSEKIDNDDGEIDADVEMAEECPSTKPPAREKTRTSPRISVQAAKCNGIDRSNSPEPMDATDNKQQNIQQTEENKKDPQEGVETEMQVQIISDKPIYPNLIDCRDDLLPVLKKVTSSMYVTSLLELLSNKGVRNIGDLAKLSELEVNRLPFKEPPVSNVFQTLDAHYKKKARSSETASASKKGTRKERNELSSACKVCPKKSPLKKSTTARVASVESSAVDRTDDDDNETVIRLRDILSWAERSRKEDATCLVNQLLGKHRSTMLPLVRDFYKANIGEVLQKPDIKLILQHAVEKVGASEVMKAIGEDAPPSPSNQKSPAARSTLEAESAAEVAASLRQLADAGKISRRELVEECLVPLVESPEDIAPCFDRLSSAELGRVFIERGVATRDVDSVIEQITRKFGNEAIYNAVNKQEILEMCSAEDMVPVVARNNDGADMVRFFERCLSSVDDEQKKNGLLIDMFKCVSSQLPVKTLAELHAQFVLSMADRIVE